MSQYDIFTSYDIAFPDMKAPELHSYFKDQLVYIFFNLTTKNNKLRENRFCISGFQDHCIQVLQLLKKQLQNYSKQHFSENEWLPYLELFYRMIAQTRDIYHGKGEHELSYMLIYALYEVFPVLAIYMIHRFVQPLPGSPITYGCWRDIKYLCDYVYSCSPNHGLIDVCIELMNNQLYKDKVVLDSGSDSSSISNVAKWIPREHKQFDWLYNLLVVDWAKHHPYILQNCSPGTSAYYRATKKLKSMYRKLISKMNRTLDTIEIKQCSRNLSEINPENVSIYTIMKQRRMFFSEDEGSKNYFLSYFENLDTGSGSGSGSHICPKTFTIRYFIKRAVQLLETPEIIYGAHHYEIEVLNKQWTRFSKSFKKYKFENILPILDMSFYMQMMDADSFYNAIGIALLLCEKSSFGKRILVLDHQPTWISLEDTSGDLLSMVQTVLYSTKSSQNTKPCMDKVIHLLLLAIQNTGVSGSAVRKMKFVLLSNFMFLENLGQHKNHHEERSTIRDMYNKIYDSFLWSCKEIPCFVFWNLSTMRTIDIKSLSNYDTSVRKHANILYLSGCGKCIYSYFDLFTSRYLVLDNGYGCGSGGHDDIGYQSFCHIMKNPRYNIFGCYLYSLYGIYTLEHL